MLREGGAVRYFGFPHTYAVVLESVLIAVGTVTGIAGSNHRRNRRVGLAVALVGVAILALTHSTATRPL